MTVLKKDCEVAKQLKQVFSTHYFLPMVACGSFHYLQSGLFYDCVNWTVWAQLQNT